MNRILRSSEPKATRIRHWHIDLSKYRSRVHTRSVQLRLYTSLLDETYGGLGNKAQDFLNELSIFAIDHAC